LLALLVASSGTVRRALRALVAGSEYAQLRLVAAQMAKTTSNQQPATKLTSNSINLHQQHLQTTGIV
jgi:hypothetical protein